MAVAPFFCHAHTKKIWPLEVGKKERRCRRHSCRPFVFYGLRIGGGGGVCVIPARETGISPHWRAFLYVFLFFLFDKQKSEAIQKKKGRARLSFRSRGRGGAHTLVATRSQSVRLRRNVRFYRPKTGGRAMGL
nr:hypothetical protein [Pandoravirus belohorizontensis]